MNTQKKPDFKDVKEVFWKLKDIIEVVTPYPSRNFVLGKLEELHDCFSMTLDAEAREWFTRNEKTT